jgi:hypothetical protein
MTLEEMQKVIEEVHCQDYGFWVNKSKTTEMIYLQAGYYEKDTVTGKLEWQKTRRWPLSVEMTKSEIVSTAFLCIKTSMEHRAREWFLYKGRAIYMPHYDVDDLAAICEKRDAREQK